MSDNALLTSQVGFQCRILLYSYPALNAAYRITCLVWEASNATGLEFERAINGRTILGTGVSEVEGLNLPLSGCYNQELTRQVHAIAPLLELNDRDWTRCT